MRTAGSTLTSLEEDEFLKAAFLDQISSEFDPQGLNGTYAWIGLTDEAVEGTYEWVTGESFAYSHWGPGEPQTIIGDEDYVHVWARSIIADSRWGWNDSRNQFGPTDTDAYFVEFAVIPEPASLGLTAFGALMLWWRAIRRER